MTDAKFKQLVNSFLDREISQKDHLLLSREVASSPQRRAEFERYRKLHAAERQALARLFATNGGVDPLVDPSDESPGESSDEPPVESPVEPGQSAGLSEERRRRAEQLKARAARAWSEVQLLTVERKKRRLLIWQFTLAGLALLFAALALYQQSVGAIPGSGNYRKESEALNPESTHLAHLREQLLARQGISVGWISNERGEPVALVGRNDEGGVFVMTSSELPRLSHLQLTALLNQLPPPASAASTPSAVLPASLFGTALPSQQPQVLRSRFVVSARTGSADALLPDADDLLSPPSLATSHRQAQPLQPYGQQHRQRQPYWQSQSPQQPQYRQSQSPQQPQHWQSQSSQQPQYRQSQPPQQPQYRQSQSSQQSQAEQRPPAESAESFIGSSPSERSVELEIFWSDTHYHTEIRTIPAAEPKSN